MEIKQHKKKEINKTNQATKSSKSVRRYYTSYKVGGNSKMSLSINENLNNQSLPSQHIEDQSQVSSKDRGDYFNRAAYCDKRSNTSQSNEELASPMELARAFSRNGKEKASHALDKSKELAEKGKDSASDALEKTKDLAEEGKEKASHAFEKSKELAEKGKDSASDAWEKTKNLAEEGKEKASHAWDRGKAYFKESEEQ